MKPTLCSSCHHLPSGRTADYGASCGCQCHDVADAGPELLAVCKAALDEITVLVPGRAADPISRRLESAIALAEGSR